MPRGYVPEAGDIVCLNFTPQVGHEQAGQRPALVLSPRAYNEKTNLMVCCPMTTQIKNYPFEVQIASLLVLEVSKYKTPIALLHGRSIHRRVTS